MGEASEAPDSNERDETRVRAIPIPQPSLLDRLQDAVFGYDFFVSYAWKDGAQYVEGLAAALANAGHRCFLDRRELRRGSSLTGGLAIGLRRAHTTLLVATPAAESNEWVAAEVRATLDRNRIVLPVVFGRRTPQLQLANAHQAALRDSVQIREPLDAWTVPPRSSLAGDIIASYRGMRRDRRARAWLAGLLLALALFATGASVFGYIAEERRKKLRVERDVGLALVEAQRAERLSARNPQLGTLVAAEAVRTTLAPHGFVVPEAETRLRTCLWSIAGEAVHRFPGGAVDAAAAWVHQDGLRLVLTGSGADGALKRTDIPPATRTLQMALAEVVDIAPSLDGREVLLGTRFGLVHRVRFARPDDRTVAIAHTHGGRQGRIEVRGLTALAWSPDATHVATGDVVGTVRLFRLLANGIAQTPVSEAKVHRAPITSLAFSADGGVVYSCALGRGVGTHGWRTGVSRLALDDVEAQHVIVRGTSIGLATSDGRVGTSDASLSRFRTIGSHGCAVTALAFDGTGEFLLSGDTEGRIGRWRLDPKALESERLVLNAHAGAVRMIAGQGHDVQSLDAEGELRRWRSFCGVPTDEPVQIAPAGPAAPGNGLLSWTGQRVFVAYDGAKPSVWDPKAGLLDVETPVSMRQTRAVDRVGRRVAWCDGAGAIRIGEPSADGGFHAVRKAGEIRLPRGNGFGAPAVTLALHPRLDLVVATADIGTLELLRPGRPNFPLRVAHAFQTAVGFSADGAWLVAGDKLGSIRAWRLGIELHTEPDIETDPSQDSIMAMALAPNSRWVLSGDDEGKLRLVDLQAAASRKEISTQVPGLESGTGNSIHAVAWSSDSTRFATIGMGQELSLFAIDADGNTRRIASRSMGTTSISMAFSPGGQTLAFAELGEGACAVLLLEASSALDEREPLRFPGGWSSLIRVAFSPDGSRLAALDGNNVCTIWSLDPRTLLRRAERAIGRQLTPTERARFCSLPR